MRVTQKQSLLWLAVAALTLRMAGGAGAQTFTTAVNPDTVPPALATPPSPQAITTTSAVINWSTTKAADSRVYFGESAMTSSAGEIEFATNHTVNLTKLTPGTAYSYQVVSVDPVGNKLTSTAYSFTTPGKTNQSISFGVAPVVAVGGSGTILATASSSLALNFGSSTPSICTVSGSTVTGVSIGACALTADQGGDASYNPATQQMLVTQIGAAAKLNQTVSFGAAPTLVVGATATFAASASSSLAVSYSSSTAQTCTVSGNSVTGVAAGACTVTASQAGDDNYNPASQVTQTFTVSQPTQTLALAIEAGWNLLGNGLDQPIPVAAVFGNPAAVTSVWKWDAGNRRWELYSPSMDAPTLQDYAADKGYSVLAAINPGEGFWVNALTQGVLSAQSGVAFNLGADGLLPGWNLVATHDAVTPSAFNRSLSLTEPEPGVMPLNLISLWTWDNAASQWYFYSPRLEADGSLQSYTLGKGLLDFSASGKTLGKGDGFWVNKP